MLQSLSLEKRAEHIVRRKGYCLPPEVSGITITVVGDAFIDIIVPPFKRVPGGVSESSFSVCVGGTANVSLQVSDLGVGTAFIGKVGNDAFGRYFRSSLAARGVKDLTIEKQNCGTGICISLLQKDGERSFLVQRGANDLLRMDEIKMYKEWLSRSEINYFSGYLLQSEESAKSLEYAMRVSKNSLRETWFNPGAPNIVTPVFKRIVSELATGLILNIDEAKALTSQENLRDALSYLMKIVEIAVVTMGVEGCILLENESITRIPSSAKQHVVNTTGAGDAFSAGFLVARVRGESPVECSRYANDIAARFLKSKGEVEKCKGL